MIRAIHLTALLLFVFQLANGQMGAINRAADASKRNIQDAQRQGPRHCAWDPGDPVYIVCGGEKYMYGQVSIDDGFPGRVACLKRPLNECDACVPDAKTARCLSQNESNIHLVSADNKAKCEWVPNSWSDGMTCSNGRNYIISTGRVDGREVHPFCETKNFESPDCNFCLAEESADSKKCSSEYIGKLLKTTINENSHDQNKNRRRGIR